MAHIVPPEQTGTYAVARTMKSGRYYGPIGPRATAGIGTGVAYFAPFDVQQSGLTVVSIGIEVTVAAATALLDLAIYSSDSGGEPSALVLDPTTNLDASTTGFKEKAISQALNPGRYWLGAKGRTAGSTVRFLNGAVQTDQFTGSPTATDYANALVGFTQGVATQAWPATVTPTVTSFAPLVLLKVA